MISHRRPLRRALLTSILLCGAPLPLLAGGGPRNVLVVVNENSPESLEIGAHYLRARKIPAANLCRVRTNATALTVSQTTYQNEIREPIRSCIAGSPYRDRLDYIVLTRGLPIRVNIPDVGSRATTPTSITALLQVMDTTLDDAEQGWDGQFLGRTNPYRGKDEYFSHSKAFGTYNLYICTMLSGLWSQDAVALVDRSVASDGNPPSAAGATFYLEDASGNASVRNAQFPAAVSNLQSRGFDAVHVLGSDPDVTGALVASHVNGGSYSGISRAEIDSNTYPPGAIVDVLESFGLVPANFEDDGNWSQTPVTWWIKAGMTGGHGTVFEPWNVAFPDAFMLEPYVDGYNLGETWYQGIPYLYWMNLVLGDPLAAPWAEPPAVSVTEPADGSTVGGTVRLAASATTPKPEGIGLVELFVDDEMVASAAGGTVQYDWDSTTVADGAHRVEAIGYENTRFFTQATDGVDIVVDNHGLSAVITDPTGGARVTAAFPVTVETSPTVTDVRVEAEGLLLGTASGSSPFIVDADPMLLGRGLHTLVATGTDGAGDSVRSAGVDVYVEKAPEVQVLSGAPQISPAEGPATGGTTVAVLGWNFEPGIRVFFGGGEATLVTRRDANHLEAVTPPGAPGPVDVRLENPGGTSATVADGFTYTAAPCAVTAKISGLTAARADAGRVSLSWPPLGDPCLASYAVYSVTGPDPAAPPVFPGDYADVTALDEDGDAGGDPAFLHTPAPGLVLYMAVGVGTDGSPGPR